MSPKSHRATVKFLKQVRRLNAWAGKLQENLTTEELKELENYGKKKFATMKNRPQGKPLKLAVRNFKFEHLNESFGINEIGFGGPEWDLPEEFWIQSPRLDCILKEFQDVVSKSSENEALIRGARLSTILLFAVGIAQVHNRNSTTSMHSAYSAHMKFEYGASMPIKYQGRLRLLRGSMDYALWCGNPYNLQANLLIVEAKARGEAGSGFTQLLVYMCMVHKARYNTMKDSSVYGIVTDSHVWHFVRINSDSTWSWTTMTWSQHAAKILAYLQLITCWAASHGAQKEMEDMYSGEDVGEETDLDDSNYTTCESDGQ